MLIIVKAKNTDNIIGLKEDIAMRLEGVVDIEMVDVVDTIAEIDAKPADVAPTRTWVKEG